MRRSTGTAGPLSELPSALLAVLLAGVLCLTGCDSESGSGGGGDSTGASTSAGASASPTGPGSPTGSPAPSASSRTPATGDVLVTATASGGIDGRHESVIVREDGAYLVVVPGRKDRPGRMKPAALAGLREALADIDFSKLPSRPHASPVPDAVTWVIVHDGHTAVTSDGGDEDTRAALEEALGALPPMR